MIGRIWRAYEELLRTEILPGITRRGIAGYRGAHLLRNDGEDEVEFVTICWFDAYDAVREFAGDDGSASVVPPTARKLLARFDDRSVHYDVILEPD